MLAGGSATFRKQPQKIVAASVADAAIQFPDKETCSDNPFRPPPKEDMLFIPMKEQQKHLEERARVRELQVWEKTTVSKQVCPHMGKPPSDWAKGTIAAAGRPAPAAADSVACRAEGAVKSTPQSGTKSTSTCVLREERLGSKASAFHSASEPWGSKTCGVLSPCSTKALEESPAPPSSEDLFTRSAHGPISCNTFRRDLAEKRRGVHARQVKMEIEREEAGRKAKERADRKKTNADAMALMRAAMKANTTTAALLQRVATPEQNAPCARPRATFACM